MRTVGKLITRAIPVSPLSANCAVRHKKCPPAIGLLINRGHDAFPGLLTSSSSPLCGLGFPPVGAPSCRGSWLAY